jgi:hypothetical protein
VDRKDHAPTDARRYGIRMNSYKSQKYIFYFVRYSLMLYPFVVFLILLPEKYELPVNDYVVSIGMLVLILPVIISLCILPGIIYEGEYKHAWHGYGKHQVHYNMLCVFTLGIGPIYIFFRKYDPLLKQYFNENKIKP